MSEFLNKIALNEDEKRLINRFHGLVVRAAQGAAGVSDFLDLRQQELAQAVGVNGDSIEWLLYGGYDEAERKRLIVYAPWDEIADTRIAYLRISHHELSGESLNHRDYLGAVLNLGLKREKLGDIVVQNNMAYMLTDAGVADFICQQLKRVKHSTISAEIISPHEFEYQPPQLTTLQLNISSLRLDAAVAAVFKLPRSQAGDLIEGGEVRINHLEVTKLSTAVKVGDLISVRGLGRFRLEEIGGLSRKGRQYVKICRW
ncbi:MAG: YlmH/Sll1252 family protein [Syntrophomonas sp.]